MSKELKLVARAPAPIVSMVHHKDKLLVAAGYVIYEVTDEDKLNPLELVDTDSKVEEEDDRN